MKAFLLALLVAAAFTLQKETHNHQTEGEILDCYAIKMGYPVSYSSLYTGWQYRIPLLDARGQSWLGAYRDTSQWIQVSSIEKKKWLGVVTQGHANYNYWVKSYKIETSQDGVYWDVVDDGYTFPGNVERSGHVRHWFETPVWARTIRLTPLSWNSWPALRLDFIFQCKS